MFQSITPRVRTSRPVYRTLWMLLYECVGTGGVPARRPARSKTSRKDFEPTDAADGSSE